MLIGILECGPVPESLKQRFGAYPAMFRRLLAPHGFDFRDWPVMDGRLPSSVHDADGWLITGSRYGAYDDLPFIAPLERFIREARDARVPMVGICFGHQIMAQALGGRVEKYRGGWAIGPTTYTLDGAPVTLNAWHQDQVIEPPEGARTIASHPFCRHAGFAYGDWAFSLQPHPEFDAPFLGALIETRGRGLVPDALLDRAVARLDQPLDADGIAARIAAFFTRARQPAG